MDADPWREANLRRGRAEVLAVLKTQAPRPVAVPRTRITWAGVRGWLDAVYDLQGTYRCATPWFQKAGRLYRSLRDHHVEACLDLADLQELEDLFQSARCKSDRLRHGLWREFDRPELGHRIVLTRNHIRWVEAGCPERREKGPAFDFARIPDDRLDWLIQRHPNLALVEQLRQERARRLSTSSD